MANCAELDENNIVVDLVVINDTDAPTENDGILF